MAGDEQWFSVHEGVDLEQGDIFLGCPWWSVGGLDSWPRVSEEESPHLWIDEHKSDSIIVSQSCDLVEAKITEILLARVFSWEILRQEEEKRGNTLVRSEQFRKNLAQSNLPAYFLLKRFMGPPALPWALVDFHHLFTLPKVVLSHVASTCGPRLRLKSPYREHLSQAFGRYFMRVGLPEGGDASKFIDEGKP